MLIYSNYRENDGIDLLILFLFYFILFYFIFYFLFFFTSKEAYLIVRQVEKMWEKNESESSKLSEKQILGP